MFPGPPRVVLPNLELLLNLKVLHLACYLNFNLDQLIIPVSHLPKLQVLTLAHFQNLAQGDKD